MEFKKIVAPTMKDLSVQQLEDKILSGELKIGTRLPSERVLSAEMNVSRAVVNSGINDLKQKGFIEILPRQGTFVTDYSKNGNLETLISLLEYRGNRLDRSEIRAIIEVRISLGQLASELVIDCASDEELNELEQTAKTLPHAKSVQEASEKAFEYHHKLAYLSHNTVLTLIYSSFKDIVISLWVKYCDIYGADSLFENIMHLQSFLRKRDKDGACTWIRKYLGESIDGSKQIYDH